MSKYEKYKPSGIEWLGDIPFHWAQRKFKNVSYMKGRIGWQGLKNEEFTFNPDEPFLITGMNFKDGEIDWNEVYHISEERFNEAPEIQIFDGDVLMTKDGTIGKLLFIDKIPYPNKASLNSHLLVFRPTYHEFYPKYLYYQLQSEPFFHHIELTKTGTTFFGITQEAVGVYKLILPTLAEQKVITTYLDREIQKIERLIANKKTQAAKLKELRQIEINYAVTKGLNPNAELKESGIDWMGKIPKHWEVKRLKRILININSGEGIKNDDLIEEGEFEIYGGNGVMGYTDKFNSEGKVIVIGRVGAKCGIVYLVDKRIWISDNALQSRTYNCYEFVYYLIDAMNLNNYANQNAQPLLTGGILKSLFAAVPPLKEQIQIANYLQARSIAIEKLIKNIEIQIDNLHELRKIKIYEAVTGKIKVNAYAETTA